MKVLQDVYNFWKEKCCLGEQEVRIIWQRMNLYTYLLNVISKLGDEQRLHVYDYLAEMDEEDVEHGRF